MNPNRSIDIDLGSSELQGEKECEAKPSVTHTSKNRESDMMRAGEETAREAE